MKRLHENIQGASEREGSKSFFRFVRIFFFVERLVNMWAVRKTKKRSFSENKKMFFFEAAAATFSPSNSCCSFNIMCRHRWCGLLCVSSAWMYVEGRKEERKEGRKEGTWILKDFLSFFFEDV